jgi:hypothetical protein
LAAPAAIASIAVRSARFERQQKNIDTKGFGRASGKYIGRSCPAEEPRQQHFYTWQSGQAMAAKIGAFLFQIGNPGCPKKYYNRCKNYP